MKVKVVLTFILSMLLLTSCFWKNETESIDDSTKEEETYSTSSTIGGWQWTPSEEYEDFRN